MYLMSGTLSHISPSCCLTVSPSRYLTISRLTISLSHASPSRCLTIWPSHHLAVSPSPCLTSHHLTISPSHRLAISPSCHLTILLSHCLTARFNARCSSWQWLKCCPVTFIAGTLSASCCSSSSMRRCVRRPIRRARYTSAISTSPRWQARNWRK